MPAIHPTAIVDTKAELAADVEVGAYAIVGPGAVIGPGCRIDAFAQVVGLTRMGRDNKVFSHAVIGNPPQDKKYAGEPTRLEIGSGNVFREFVTINTGTVQDNGCTIIGDRNWIMAYVHIAHDCRVGSDTIMANAVQLAGHVTVGDWAILGGITGVHQFVRVGPHAMTGAGTTLLQDLPPYVLSNGNPASAHGLNSEGLRRRGFSEQTIRGLKQAYRHLYKSGLSFADSILAIEASLSELDDADQPAVAALVDFLRASGRGIVR